MSLLLSECVGSLLAVPEDDSESVCSSLDGSILSDEGESGCGPLCVCVCVGGRRGGGGGGFVSLPLIALLSEGGTDDTDSDTDLQFHLTEHIDQLTDKK